MSEPKDYGDHYWCVRVSPDLSADGKIYLFAEEIAIQGGALVFLRAAPPGKPRPPVLALAAEQWIAFYAASILDGRPVAVEHWTEEKP